MNNYQNANLDRLRAGNRPSLAPLFYRPQRAFTLIELLVVISIIAVLASFSIPVIKSVTRKKILDRTRSEMTQLETAIEGYKAAFGFYPPSNPNYNPGNSATWQNVFFSPLYYELLGTANDNPANPNIGNYSTLDGSADILASALTVASSPLGVSGFINCSKPGGGEDAPVTKNFLTGLTPNRIGYPITNKSDLAHPVTLLLGSVGGPDQIYQPMGAPNVNPWRYVSPGVNNPNSYDLWIQLVISGKTNLICNWSKQVQINSPLP